MTFQEKILLIQLILEDIRNDWNFEPKRRAKKARDLCKDKEILELIPNFDELETTIECYIGGASEDYDGRYFRDTYPDGYLSMEVIHGLPKTYEDKSQEFQKLAKEVLVYPEYLFTDWEKQS